MLLLSEYEIISHSSSNEKCTEFLYWQQKYFPSTIMEAQGFSKISHLQNLKRITKQYYLKIIINVHFSPLFLPHGILFSLTHHFLFICKIKFYSSLNFISI